MPPIHRMHRTPRALLIPAMLAAFLGALLLGRSFDSSAEPATPGATTTPMAEATIDDVTIRLLSWEQTDAFTAEIEIVNNSSDPIGVPQSLVQFEAQLPDGSTAVRALRSSSPSSCALGPGQTGRMTLEFDSVEGQIPVNLQVGIAEPYRTGAHVVFPLNANQGASAVGGNAIAGNSAPAASPAASGSPVATPAYECTD
jgi:hypothetical protein